MWWQMGTWWYMRAINRCNEDIVVYEDMVVCEDLVVYEDVVYGDMVVC